MNSHTATDWAALPLVFSAAGVGKILGLSMPSTYALFHRQGFPVIRVSERRQVVSRDALRRWLEEGSVTA